MSRWHGSMPLILFLLASASSLTASAAEPQAQSGGVDPQKAGEALAQATARIAERCANEAELHGAWVRLEPDATSSSATSVKFQAHVLLDADREQQQMPQVLALLSQLPVGGTPRIVQPVHRAPLARLVQSLQETAVSAGGKPGCFVRGAYYASDNQQQLVVTPYGRLSEGPPRDAVVTRFARETSRAEWDDFVKFAGGPARPALEKLASKGPSHQLVQAYRWLDEALAGDRVLKGVRVELAECLDHRGELSHFDVYQYVTEDRAEAQRAKLSQMLKERLGDGYLVMTDKALPLVRLINRLNLVIESRPSLNGCWIDGAYFTGEYPQVPAPGGGAGTVAGPRQSKMVLYGQVADERLGKQRQWLAELAGALIQLDPDWKPCAGDFATVADDLAVVLPSPGRGQVLFGQGVTMFWNRRYEDAWRAFHYATLEMPDSLVFRYWRILAEMELGRTSDALDHLVAVVGRAPTPATYRQVITSLHRVQGPLRAELLRLETEARFEFYSRRHEMLFGYSASN